MNKEESGKNSKEGVRRKTIACVLYFLPCFLVFFQFPEEYFQLGQENTISNELIYYSS
jgi:hypothetical protein